MFNIFNSHVFIEIGQAIGNVGGKLFGHGRAEMVESILKRRLREASALSLPELSEPVSRPQEEAIEASYRILAEKEEQ
ncbi:MAG: hypothetical protein H5T71_00120 [Chloroflexi bacterium]|nr:hypothetical protein [Chloroflexota bacterium]